MKRISKALRVVRLPRCRGWAERLHGRRAAELQGVLAARGRGFSLPQLFTGWAALTRSGSCTRPASCAASLTAAPGLLLRRLRWSPIRALPRLRGIPQGLGDCNENGLVRYLIQSSLPFLTCNQSLTLIFKNLHHLLNSLRPHQVWAAVFTSCGWFIFLLFTSITHLWIFS
jgi:hypothetical protein